MFFVVVTKRKIVNVTMILCNDDTIIFPFLSKKKTSKIFAIPPINVNFAARPKDNRRKIGFILK